MSPDAVRTADPLNGLRALVGRRAPGLRGRLHLGLDPDPGRDPDVAPTEQVLIHATGGRLHVTANTPSAAAVGLAHALETFFDADLSLDGPPVLDVSAPLPETTPHRLSTPLRTRYHLNPVTFGYTMAFWDWPRWEQHIDWMALHGVTAPLNLVGHDAVLVRMLVDLGLDRDTAARFVGGPAFLPWTSMGITHDLGAALTEEALAARAGLGRRIAERERELGMTVVLPGFGGQLPADLAGTERTIDWQGWENALVDPSDPLFAEAAAALHRHQSELLGTDHLYAVDPYIESLPPTTSEAQLAEHAEAIFTGMDAADPQAVWILQGWPFHYRKGYWTGPRVRSLLSRVPEERLLLLDLWGEHAPMWQSTDAMFGRRWLWCLTHSFGGRFGLFGDLDALAQELGAHREALSAEHRTTATDDSGRPAPEGLGEKAPDGDETSAPRGRLEGFGITAEALDENAVVFELATRAVWGPMPSTADWLDRYGTRRWGAHTPEVRAAWDLLSRTLYGPGRTRATPSPLIARPWSRALPFAAQRLAGEALPTADGPPSANLDAENDMEMLSALGPLATAVRSLVPLLERDDAPEALHHDLVQFALHVGAQSARAPLRAMVAATETGGTAIAASSGSAVVHEEFSVLEALLLAADAVAATRPEQLVGLWIAKARAVAGDDGDLADALERDARSLISVWGTQESGLHDYSARHWSGSLSGLHLERWRAWAGWLAAGAEAPTPSAPPLPSGPWDPGPLQDEIRRIEEDWRDSRAPYPLTPHGDTATAVLALLDLAETQLPRLASRDRAGVERPCPGP